MSQLYTYHYLSVNLNIPDELIAEILKWVPAKSLVSFMSVCKSWYNLITSPNFISTHLNHQIAITNNNLETRYLIYNYAIFYYDTYLLYCDNHDFTKHFELICKESEAIPIGYCDGIVCLIDNLSVFLWNPSLRKYLGLRMPLSILSFGTFRTGIWNFVYGFGFDALTNDYKVVSIAYLRNDSPETKSHCVYVYSLNAGAWKVVNASFSWDDECVIMAKAVYLNGVIHWVVERNYDDDHYVPAFILTFNLAEETFSHIQLPEDVMDVPIVSDSDLNGRVDLMTVKRNGEDFLAALQSDSVRVKLWVMAHDDVVESWREEFSIKRDVDYRCFENVTTNGELVMQLKEGSMVSLNPRTMRMKHISNRKMNYVGTYVESLILLKPVESLSGANCGDFVP